METKKIGFVIRVPKIHFRGLFTPRVFLSLALAVLVYVIGYWYVAIRPILWISGARVEALSSTFSADTIGRIMEIGLEEGNKVAKGQILFSLDNHLVRAQKNQCEAKITALNEQIQSEKLRMEKAMQKYLSVSNELDFTVGSAEAIQKNLAILEDAQAKSEAASSLLSSLELEAAIIDEHLKKMRVLAPFDGIVLKKWKNLGETVSSGENVCALFDPKQTWVALDISEVYLNKIALGMPVQIRLAAYPQQEWSGKVVKISPSTSDKVAEKASIRLHVSIEPNDLFLRPGLSASVSLKVR